MERAGGERRRRVAAAASIVLLVGAGAAWAVPGSPLRSWWEGLRAGEPIASTLAPEVAEVEPVPALVQDDPVGVGVPLVFDRVDVSFEAVPEGAVLEVRIVDGERAWVEAPEGTSFEVEAATGTARAFVGSGSGRIRVELPRRATGSSVRVNGATLYPPASPAEASDGVFLIPVPGGPSDGAPGGDPGTGPGGGG
jgi:hypothetical protein